MMPNPLDVGFAALDNDQAGLLLAPELEKYSLRAGSPRRCGCSSTRTRPTFWDDNLYNLWLRRLRALSPATRRSRTRRACRASRRPRPWGRRLLNTQLASWAELRHDTMLYAKQSYTGGASCEFPDAYVDPYPAFYGKIAELAEHGEAIGEDARPLAEPVARDADPAVLPGAPRRRRDAARHGARTSATASPLTQAQLAFINQAVVIQLGCGDPEGSTAGMRSSSSTTTRASSRIRRSPTCTRSRPTRRATRRPRAARRHRPAAAHGRDRRTPAARRAPTSASRLPTSRRPPRTSSA